MMRADLYRARPACLRIPGMNDWQNVLYFALVSRVYVMPDVMTRYNFMLKDSWTIKNFNDSSVMRDHLVFEVAKIREIWAYYRFIRREAFEALMARYEEQIHKMSGSLVDYDLPEDVKE